MLTPAQILRRLTAAFRGTAHDRDMDEEMRFHLAMETEDDVRRGVPTEAARRNARLAFGGVERFREEALDARGLAALRGFAGDLRFAARMLRRSPLFVTVATATLAIAIGANTAIFSVVRGVVLAPLPFSNADELVSVWDGGRSLAEFEGIRSRTQTLSSVAAYRAGYAVTLGGDAEPLRLNTTLVSSGFFDVLGVKPALGRFFREGEDRLGSAATVVLSHALWRTRFGGDSSIVGRTIPVDGEGRLVIGVTPANFRFPASETRAWVPFRIQNVNAGLLWGAYGHQIIGRLRQGVSHEQAREDVHRIATMLQAENPVWRPALPDYVEGIAVSELRAHLVHDNRDLLFVLLGAVGLVLLLACANVANLLMVRGAIRAKEMAIRAALGAGTARLARQLFAENALLVTLGGVAGVLVAFAGLRLVVSLLPAGTPRLAEVSIDGFALAFTIAITALAGLAFGVFPAYRTARASGVPTAGNRMSAGAAQRQLTRALVSTQIAVAVVLSVGAGLLVRSLTQMLDIDPGFPTAQLVTATVSPPRLTYDDTAKARHLAEGIVERLTEARGIEAAAVTSQMPFDQENRAMAMWIDGWTTDPNRLDLFDVRKVAGDFFGTMNIRIVRGRAFTPADASSSARVVIISETAAKRFWAGRDPIGGQIRYPWPGWMTVIGVAADVRNNDLKLQPQPALYVPYAHSPDLPVIVVARTSNETQAFAAIRDAVRAVAPDAPVTNEQTIQASIERSVSSARASAVMLLAFGALAVLLGTLGTYGLVAYGVESRQRELAVRMAVGAGAGRVVRHVVREGALIAAIGIAVGVAGAFALTRFLRGMLFGVGTTDPVSFAVAPIALLLAALAACAIPAWRATRVDPTTVLRRD